MTLSVVLEHPDVGVVTPPIVSGNLQYVLDRYPRFRLTVVSRPNPRGMDLWQSPYGTKAFVFRKTGGELMFTGHIISADVQRPDGQFGLEGADDITLLTAHKFSERPGQFLPGSTMDVPAFIRLVAATVGVAVTVTGSGGTVNVSALDVAGKQAWALVEEQLIANDLDVWVQPDGALQVGPTAVLKDDDPDHAIGVGNTGTITGYTVAMARIYNRVIVTHQCQKQGEDDKYVDGVWEDLTSIASVGKLGPNVYTSTVRVGEDWWANPTGFQAQANANAAAIAQTIGGYAREATISLVPDYTIQTGHTVDVTFRAGVKDRFLVTAVNLPLGVGPMEITCRNPDPGWPGSTFLQQPSKGRRRYANH